MCLPVTHKWGAYSPLSRPDQTAGILLTAIALFSTAASAADLTAATERSFNRYVQLSETRMKQNSGTGCLFAVDENDDEKAKLRQGSLLILRRQTLDGGKEIKVPDALVQDWLGSIFIPSTTIAQVRSIMQAYPDYKKYFAPEIIESKILSHQDDRYTVFLRLYKKQILTVVLNATYEITYTAPDPKCLTVDSRSTRIAEVKDSKGYDQELPPGHDTGFLWRLNSYWRFEQADGGVYVQCEAISLSRDVPFGLFMIRKFVERFPKESMQHTLEGLRAAVGHP